MKTTAKDFEIFKKECQYWIDYFGLKDWDINYKHEVLEEYDGAMNSSNIDDLSAVIWLDMDIEQIDQIDDRMIRLSAFHEVCEVMMSELTVHMQHAFSSKISYPILHRVIHRLENSIFEEHYQKRFGRQKTPPTMAK